MRESKLKLLVEETEAHTLSLLKLLSEPKMKLIVYIYIFLSGPLAFVSSVTELAWGCSSEQAFGRDD